MTIPKLTPLATTYLSGHLARHPCSVCSAWLESCDKDKARRDFPHLLLPPRPGWHFRRKQRTFPACSLSREGGVLNPHMGMSAFLPSMVPTRRRLRQAPEQPRRANDVGHSVCEPSHSAATAAVQQPYRGAIFLHVPLLLRQHLPQLLRGQLSCAGVLERRRPWCMQ